MSTHSGRSLLAVTFASVIALSACSSTKPTPTVAQLTVSCDTTALSSLGQQARCSVRATMSDGTTTDVSASAQWSSSDATKVTVSNAGVVIAIGAGTADVIASLQGATARQTFRVSASCTFSIAPASVSFGSSGGSQNVAVTAAPAGCAPATWIATSNNARLSVQPESGSGAGTVTVTAAASSLTTAQSLTAAIAGQTFEATVAAARPCSYTFAADAPDANGNAWRASAASGERRVIATVTSNGSSCAPWTATSDNWITVSPTSATDSTTVRLDYEADTGAPRTGTVTFRPPDCSPACGESYTVFIDQAGPAAFSLNLTLAQGHHLSGPYAATVTGPNGYTCSIEQLQESVDCPTATFSNGSTVQLVVTVTKPAQLPNDPTIFNSSGCDVVTSQVCTVVMRSDRTVRIGAGVLEP
jgi:hypothetical protein